VRPALERIISLMTTGASLIVSDLGMSHETTPRGRISSC
jgi:hypothetical protein